MVRYSMVGRPGWGEGRVGSRGLNRVAVAADLTPRGRVVWTKNGPDLNNLDQFSRIFCVEAGQVM